jgi:heme exporter protein CcmD
MIIDWAADHISFVIAAYAIVAAVLGVTVAWILWRASALKKTLADMNLPDTGQKDDP